MIEGRTRGDISRAKEMLRTEPGVLRALLERIARATAAYLQMQIAAGAAVVQLFDTWAGELTEQEYETFELPATRMVLESLAKNRNSDGVPKILFAKGSAHLLQSVVKSGADVISVDWRTDLADARQKFGRRVALQGNVDPAILLGAEMDIREAARTAVQETGGLGHILNLGHGILPTTPVANAKAFVEAGQTAPIPKPEHAGNAD
jgi:uroporphyrinogen decarboxylase